jgi:choline dehydrogenase
VALTGCDITDADVTRVGAARALLRSALSRPNVTLLLKAHEVKLNFQGTRCLGVKVKTDGAVKDVEAGGEVIVAAGDIGRPKLLMLSGVGTPRHFAVWASTSSRTSPGR